MPGRGRKASIPREQRRFKRFGECDIDGVIGCEIVPQSPDARQQKIMWISAQGKVGQVGESRAATLWIDLTGHCIPAKDLRYFHVEQMRRVQGLSSTEQPPFHRLRR